MRPEFKFECYLLQYNELSVWSYTPEPIPRIIPLCDRSTYEMTNDRIIFHDGGVLDNLLFYQLHGKDLLEKVTLIYRCERYSDKMLPSGVFGTLRPLYDKCWDRWKNMTVGYILQNEKSE